MGFLKSIARKTLGRTYAYPITKLEAPTRERLKVGPDTIDSFVRRVDELGGPSSEKAQAYWRNFHYAARAHVDQRIDPYGNDYTDQQIALYREISGRDINQSENELTQFDLPTHVSAVNPYAHFEPTAMGLHISRLAKVLEYSGLSQNDHLIDMGCGWGMSSELFAYSGLRVTALDINPNFVELVRRRTERTGYRITPVQGSFEQIPGTEVFDGALFYESLHHAIRPWEALTAVAARLKPGGKLLLAGEPVNEMWRAWGIRTDALSVYCIRKFGWFESGWSPAFLRECIERCGLSLTRCGDEGGSIGWIVVAEKR